MNAPTSPHFTLFEHPEARTQEEMLDEATDFRDRLRKRRTIRDYSSRPVPNELIDVCIQAGATAPSGANQQPWHFVVVTDREVKARIRVAAEEEEKAFYSGRAPQEWLDALAHIGTDENKEFLETAATLIVIFAKNYDLRDDGSKLKNYYVQESVGIATGMLISALHLSGLSTLTHTPSPMSFLTELLERPKNERAYILLVVGYPADNATVPTITKKTLAEYRTIV